MFVGALNQLDKKENVIVFDNDQVRRCINDLKVFGRREDGRDEGRHVAECGNVRGRCGDQT